MAQHMINYPWGSSEVTHVPPGAHIESEEIAALKAERDRLQKERDGIELELCQRAENWEAERDRLTIIADAIQAERDRLLAALDANDKDRERLALGWNKASDEQDRLREALEQIAKADNTAWDMCEIARRALEEK
jgi:septal ring factor EnvC (AmiA/AmiB activator)